jgi:uncharacterized protein YndB with AHSA1/START domain
MKWLFIAGTILAALALVAGIVALIGSRIPRAHARSREARLAAQPEAVWQTITDVDGYSSWRDGVTRVERLPDRAGKTAWIEHGSSGHLTLVVDRAEPPRALVVRIADPDLPFGGTWTYEISPAAGGSVIRITENGEIYNPVFRFMARFVFGYDATMAAYLASLVKKFGGDVR